MIRRLLLKLHLWLIEDEILVYEEGRRRLQSLYDERANLQRSLWASYSEWSK